MKTNRVIIVGRVNIGKSTLFNRLSTTVKSIVFEEEGVTRDYIKDMVTWRGTEFELVDSAGLSFRKSLDPLSEKVRLSALELFETSALIIFVVDGTSGILPADYDIAKAVHKSGKKTLLAVNKMDTRLAQENLHEFDRLGFKQVFPISAQHGTGVPDLLDGVVDELFDEEGTIEEPKPQFKVVLLGKPNVGKSSLMNALLQEQRSLVTDIPGTTREAIHETIQFQKETLEIIDTPGVRRKKTIEEELEGMMVKSALQAVRESHIVLLLIDAAQGMISDQELKLTYYAFEEQKKALMIIYNKQDLVTEKSKKDLEFSLEEFERLMDKVVSMNISCKTGKNIGKILANVQDLWERYSTEFSQEQLVLWFKSAMQRTPLYKSGRMLRLASAKQINSTPITIALYVTEPLRFGQSQIAFFDNVLRSHADLKGVPVKFLIRKG